jgi:WD40 repeat protein
MNSLRFNICGLDSSYIRNRDVLDLTSKVETCIHPEHPIRVCSDHLLSGHKGSVRSVAVSPDGNYIVSGSGDKTIRVWDAETGEMIGRPLEGHEGGVTCVAFFPDGKRIASGSEDGTIRVWNVESGKETRASFPGHNDIIISVSLSSSGSVIVSGLHSNYIRLWNVETGEMIGVPFNPSDEVRSITFSPNERHVVFCSRQSAYCVGCTEKRGDQP